MIFSAYQKKADIAYYLIESGERLYNEVLRMNRSRTSKFIPKNFSRANLDEPELITSTSAAVLASIRARSAFPV
jgi:hypothetical protein